MTGKKIIPEYLTRHKVEVIVPETMTKPIIDDLFQLKPTRGKVFVTDVSEAYDLYQRLVEKTLSLRLGNIFIESTPKISIRIIGTILLLSLQG